MQRRAFGDTGLNVSLLGFGGFHLLEIPVSEAGFLLNRYLDAGGNYIETAAAYGDGESERKIGRSVSARRGEFILATKSGERSASGLEADLRRSLSNLKTDYADLLLLHAVGSREELDRILAPGGALEGALKAKRDGRIRHIGISMHGQSDVLVRALQEWPFAAVMTTINYYDRFNFPDIEDALLPLAKTRKAAVILMKPVADGLLWRSAPQAFRYAFSQPVSVVVAGINNRDMLEADLRFAEEFTPLSGEETHRLYEQAPELGTYVCRQCGKCLVCPEGIPLPEIFRYEGYFDRQMADGTVTNASDWALKERLRFWFGNKDLARQRYAALPVKGNACTDCGICNPTCPYGIDVRRKLALADYKLANRDIF